MRTDYAGFELVARQASAAVVFHKLLTRSDRVDAVLSLMKVVDGAPQKQEAWALCAKVGASTFSRWRSEKKRARGRAAVTWKENELERIVNVANKYLTYSAERPRTNRIPKENLRHIGDPVFDSRTSERVRLGGVDADGVPRPEFKARFVGPITAAWLDTGDMRSRPWWAIPDTAQNDDQWQVVHTFTVSEMHALRQFIRNGIASGETSKGLNPTQLMAVAKLGMLEVIQDAFGRKPL